MAERKIYPLSKLAESIGLQIEKAFEGAYWITAEISKLNYYPQSGHCYPQLVEKREGKIVADIRAFLLNTRYADFNRRFAEATGQTLADGMQILLRCKVGYHAVYGLSLNIVDIEPAYTLGEMARMRNEALKQLQTEGLYALNKSLHLPLLLKRLAVVSVETSKGWRDFRSSLDEGPYGSAIHTQLFPALLQGDAAVESIGKALDYIAARAHAFDAVCIIRGGGGETGLDCYDNYGLAAKVCRMPLPLITGIGHATNLTLVEQVAHRNMITPTALAAFITDGFADFEGRINTGTKALQNLQRGLLRNHLNQLERRHALLNNAGQSRLQAALLHLQKDGRRFETAAKKAVGEHLNRVQFRLPAKLDAASRQHMARAEQQLLPLLPRLQRSTPGTLHSKLQHLDLLSEKNRMLDPSFTLARGYSITTLHGHPVTDAAQLKAGDTIETRFANGSASSTVNP